MEAPVIAAVVASCEMPAEIRPVKCLPKAKSSVAPSMSQGSTCRKVCAGVLMRRNAPARPPRMLVRTRGIITRRGMFSFWGYAPPLAVVPTHRASVLVALAGMGGTPTNKRAGKETKLPQPATALIPPPRAPAKNRKMAVCGFKWRFYHESSSSSKERTPRAQAAAQCIIDVVHVLTSQIRAKSFLDNERRPVYERGVPEPFRQ